MATLRPHAIARAQRSRGTLPSDPSVRSSALRNRLRGHLDAGRITAGQFDALFQQVGGVQEPARQESVAASVGKVGQEIVGLSTGVFTDALVGIPRFFGAEAPEVIQNLSQEVRRLQTATGPGPKLGTFSPENISRNVLEGVGAVPGLAAVRVGIRGAIGVLSAGKNAGRVGSMITDLLSITGASGVVLGGAEAADPEASPGRSFVRGAILGGVAGATSQVTRGLLPAGFAASQGGHVVEGFATAASVFPTSYYTIKDSLIERGMDPAEASRVALDQAITETIAEGFEAFIGIGRSRLPALGQEAGVQQEPTAQGSQPKETASVPAPPTPSATVAPETGQAELPGFPPVTPEQAPAAVDQRMNIKEAEINAIDGNGVQTLRMKYSLNLEQAQSVRQEMDLGGPPSTDSLIRRAALDRAIEQGIPITVPTVARDALQNAGVTVRGGQGQALRVSERQDPAPRTPEMQMAFNFVVTDKTLQIRKIDSEVDRLALSPENDPDGRAVRTLFNERDAVMEELSMVLDADRLFAAVEGRTLSFRRNIVVPIEVEFSRQRMAAKAKANSPDGRVSPELTQRLNSLSDNILEVQRRISSLELGEREGRVNDTVRKGKSRRGTNKIDLTSAVARAQELIRKGCILP